MHKRGKNALAAVVFVGIILLSSLSPARENEIKDFEIALTKAALSVENGDYAEAIKLFKQALAVKPGDKDATVGLGIAYSRSGDLPAAKASLLKALALDPSDARTRYELGVVLYKLGATEEAKDFFAAVADSHADETLKTAARKYLALVTGTAHEGKKYSLGVTAGLQYDSNVVLEPENPIAAAPSRKSDTRAVLTVDAGYRLYKSDTTSVDAGYAFYQSVHRQLHDFNVQQHGLKLGIVYDLSQTTQLGVKYRYTYDLVGGNRFYSAHETMPYVTLQLLPKSLTEFHILYDKNRYYNTGLFPANAEQSGTDSGGGFIHTFRIGAASTMSIGYDFDLNNANERFWSYRGNKGSLGIQSALGGYTATFAMSYYDQRYRDTATESRHDGTQEYTAGLSRNIGKDLSLMLNDLYTIHDSNLAPFEYTRNIVGFFVVTRL